MPLSRYYKCLELPNTATQQEVKAAYRKMAFKYHPDRNPGDSPAEEKFKEIVNAYEMLRDIDVNKTTDSQEDKPKYRRKPVKKKKTRGKTRDPSPEEESSSHSKTSTSTQYNLRYNIFVTLEDILTGCEKIIRFIRSNKGQKENIQLKIQIPKGARHHQRLKISNFGAVTADYTGDLFVVVHHQPHHLFDVDGLDLFCKTPIRYIDALLGNPISLPTLSGMELVTLKSCQFNNIQFIFPGKGLPNPSTQERGQLVIECIVCNPDNITAKEKNALQNLSESWPKSDRVKQYFDQFTKEDVP